MTLRLGHAIAVSRAAKGWSRSRLASSSRLSPSTLSLVESSKRQLSVEVLMKVCQALEIPLHVLMLLASDVETVEKTSPEVCWEVVKWLMEA